MAILFPRARNCRARKDSRSVSAVCARLVRPWRQALACKVDDAGGSRMSFLPNRNLVLVVDDDAAMLNGVKRLLRQHDYETILFSSAKAFMTGNEDPAVRNAAVGSGCIAFLTKPFSAQSLIESPKKASAVFYLRLTAQLNR